MRRPVLVTAGGPEVGRTLAEPSGAAVVAVDVGGTTVKGALVDARGDVLALRVVPTSSPGASPATTVRDLVGALITDAHALGHDACGVGVASPGLVDAERGVVEFAANLGWRDHPLMADLDAAFGLPVRLDHDARAGLLAERSARRDPLTGQLPTDMAFVPIGTGIATAVVSGGAVLRGGGGAAGELGHVVVVPGGEPCACGQRGCVEAYASAASIARRYAARSGRAGSTSADVVARLGLDAHADEVWHEAVDALALALASLTALLDPLTLVVGGGLAQAGRALSEPLEEALAAALPWRQPPTLETSRVGPGASLVGAALLALDAAVVPAAPGFHQRASSGAGALQHTDPSRSGGRR